MVFTSWTFVVFFAAVLGLVALARTTAQRQLVILLSSIVFYGWVKPIYLLILATPSVIDYICALAIEDSNDARVRRRWLVGSMVSNLALLAYFKYTNFFLENIAALLGVTPVRLDIVLPVGISFFTFKTMSYTIDVYRRELTACRSFWRYAMFVTYFPELVAGPIVRASVFLPQLGRSLEPSWSRAWIGSQAILLGLSKKLLVADRLAPFSDAVFATPEAYGPLAAITAVLCYTLQIYCDFSGYSDIAIGTSKIIGFDLPENFNMPYLATSVTEFWRRWHITFSQWLRDYLYIPLGGNRRGRLRTDVNLMLTMLIGGLWHGASWTFVVWGALHGVALAVHKLWRRVGIDLPAVVAWAITFVFVCVTWVFFRATDVDTAVTILRKVAFIDREGISWTYTPLWLLLPFVVAAHAFGVAAARLERGEPVPVISAWAARASQPLVVRPTPLSGLYVVLPLPGFWGTLMLTAWLVGIFLFASVESSPFIYFQF